MVPHKKASGVDNTVRRTWDKEEFRQKAEEKEKKAKVQQDCHRGFSWQGEGLQRKQHLLASLAAKTTTNQLLLCPLQLPCTCMAHALSPAEPCPAGPCP